MGSFFATVVAVLWLFVPSGAALAQDPPACQFLLGFGTLAALIPRQVGQCVDDERHDPASGDARQHTTGGVLLWRKAENWTAFTDGEHTWINNGVGTRARRNAERFPWEAPVTPDPIDFTAFVTQTFAPLASAGLPSLANRFTTPVVTGTWRSGATSTDAAALGRVLADRAVAGPAAVVGIDDDPYGSATMPPGRYALLALRDDDSWSRALIVSFVWQDDHWAIDQVWTSTASIPDFFATGSQAIASFEPFPPPPTWPMALADLDGHAATLSSRTFAGSPVTLEVPDGWVAHDTYIGNAVSAMQLDAPDGANRVEIAVSLCTGCGFIVATTGSAGSVDALGWRRSIPADATRVDNHGWRVTYWLPDLDGQPRVEALVVSRHAGAARATWVGPWARTVIAQTVLESLVMDW